jgi:deazaflavin-dependent oxidoreductase (nitroreductase family)
MRIIQEFRAYAGKVGGPFAGKSLLLLHTIGAKSGQPRINPVACIRDGDCLVLIASKGGSPTNPDWYYNIRANPLVTVETGTEQFQARAAIVAEPERTQDDPHHSGDHPDTHEINKRKAKSVPKV